MKIGRGLDYFHKPKVCDGLGPVIYIPRSSPFEREWAMDQQTGLNYCPAAFESAHICN